MLESGDDDEREAAATPWEARHHRAADDPRHPAQAGEVLEFSKEASCGGVLFALGAIACITRRKLRTWCPG